MGHTVKRCKKPIAAADELGGFDNGAGGFGENTGDGDFGENAGDGGVTADGESGWDNTEVPVDAGSGWDTAPATTKVAAW